MGPASLASPHPTPPEETNSAPWDNAVVGSFFASLKSEGAEWRTRDEARPALFEYLEVWYNRRRWPSTLGYLAPPSSNSGDVPPVFAGRSKRE